MKWFGESWGAVVCQEADHLPQVPEGSCQGCGMAVEDIDSGLALPRISLSAGLFAMTVATTLYHHGCFLSHVGVLTVHIVHEGRSYCEKPGVPGSWPAGHKWVTFDEFRLASCPECRQLGGVKYPPDREAQGLVATLGWDWAEFQTRVKGTPAHVLTLVEAILKQEPRPDEPPRVQERSTLGLEILTAEFERRA